MADDVNWLEEQYKRSKARLASLPRWARPIVTGPAFDRGSSDDEYRGCRCGHPGAGCYCP